MNVLIAGSLEGELKYAAEIASARGAKLWKADDVPTILRVVRVHCDIGLILVELPFDIGNLARTLQLERFHIPIVACGARTRPSEAAQAISEGAREFLPLPADPDLIASILEAASGESHMLIASDPVMINAVRRAEKIAGSDASVFVTGESGTGKEVLARHIHRRSPRTNNPFIAINCAAIPETLLESELFGHEKGAFSGAIARRLGKFEAADRGTILLDEISEMDIRLQAKLLRVIQEREVDRVGGSSPVKINVRIIATSNRSLKTEVAAGRFRQDLYFRLNVVSLHIPALRERPKDICVLADHYAKHYAMINGKAEKHFSSDGYARLQRHTWPGNVRELENTVHRAVLLASSRSTTLDELELGDPGVSPAVSGHMTSLNASVGRTMEAVERDLILDTLQHTFGNRTHAATMLGISIRCLRNKLREYTDAGVAVVPAQNSHAA